MKKLYLIGFLTVFATNTFVFAAGTDEMSQQLKEEQKETTPKPEND
jgi:hypothetical protein